MILRNRMSVKKSARSAAAPAGQRADNAGDTPAQPPAKQ